MAGGNDVGSVPVTSHPVGDLSRSHFRPLRLGLGPLIVRFFHLNVVELWYV